MALSAMISRLSRPALLATLAVAGLPSGPARADTVAAVDQAIANQATILQRFTPKEQRGTIDIQVQDQRARIPVETARTIQIRLTSLTLEGAETVPMAELRPIWEDRIGTTVTLADLYAIADRIDAAYRQAGYFSMTVVPVQDFSTGRISLRLYESYLREVILKSNVPGLETRLAPYIERLTAMRPIRIKEAERVLLLMSDLGGLRVEGTFRRPDRPSGGGELMLEISFTRFGGQVSLDNLGTSTAGPLELSGMVGVNDVLHLFETTSLVGMTVPDTPQELAFLQAGQEIPLGSDGLRLGYTLSYISSQPGGELSPLDLDIKAGVASVFLSYPVVRTIGTSLYGRLDFNARDNDIDAGGVAVTRDRVRWLTAGVSYDQTLGSAQLGATATFGQGLDGLGANGESGALLSRDGTPDDYRFFRLGLDISRPLWENASLSVRGLGQYSPDPLPPAVQMTLGGDPYGRAFDGSSAAGDSGLAAAVELNQGFDLSLPDVGNTEVFGFVDYGVLWNHDVSMDYTRQALGSVGFGLAATLAERLNAQALLAVPWEDEEALTDTGTRVFFRVSTRF